MSLFISGWVFDLFAPKRESCSFANMNFDRDTTCRKTLDNLHSIILKDG